MISKSSAVPIFFNTSNIKISTYPNEEEIKNICESIKEKNTYILYPHKNAVTVDDLDDEELKKIDQIIAVDCTWYQINVNSKENDWFTL